MRVMIHFAIEKLRKLFRHWRRATKGAIYDKIEEAERMQRIRYNTMMNAWVAWKDKHVQHQLKPIVRSSRLAVPDRSSYLTPLKSFMWNRKHKWR